MAGTVCTHGRFGWDDKEVFPNGRQVQLLTQIRV